MFRTRARVCVRGVCEAIPIRVQVHPLVCKWSSHWFRSINDRCSSVQPTIYRFFPRCPARSRMRRKFTPTSFQSEEDGTFALLKPKWCKVFQLARESQLVISEKRKPYFGRNREEVASQQWRVIMFEWLLPNSVANETKSRIFQLFFHRFVPPSKNSLQFVRINMDECHNELTFDAAKTIETIDVDDETEHKMVISTKAYVFARLVTELIALRSF